MVTLLTDIWVCHLV